MIAQNLGCVDRSRYSPRMKALLQTAESGSAPRFAEFARFVEELVSLNVSAETTRTYVHNVAGLIDGAMDHVRAIRRLVSHVELGEEANRPAASLQLNALVTGGAGILATLDELAGIPDPPSLRPLIAKIRTHVEVALEDARMLGDDGHA